MSSENEPNRPYLNFDGVAEEYDRTRYLPLEMARKVARLLQEEAGLEAEQALLDAGVGTGRFALPMAELGVRVVGVDISENMMTALRRKAAQRGQEEGELPVRLARGDLRHLPFASGAFGAALAVHILHLIADWQQVLQEARRVLKPGGPLLLGVETGKRVPTRDFYFEQAQQRGLLGDRPGASLETVRNYLATQGARVTQVDADRLRWKVHAPIAQTLEHLSLRTWSSLWAVPDEAHARLMQETTEWARQQYGSLDAVEDSESKVQVWAARWPSS